MDELKEYLNEKEISEIQMFLERPLMMEAVRKVIFRPVLTHGIMKPGQTFEPNKNYLLGVVSNQVAQGMINNEMLGENLRASWEAVRLITNGFNELEKLKKVQETIKTKTNIAR